MFLASGHYHIMCRQGGISVDRIGKNTTNPFRPNIAKLKDFFELGNEIIYICGDILEIKEVVVNHRLRFRLKRKVSSGGVLAEKATNQQITLDCLRRVPWQFCHFHKT